MKTIKTKASKQINWALPGQSVTHEEFMSAIQKAEEGSFYTVQESMQHFEEWLKLRAKQ